MDVIVYLGSALEQTINDELPGALVGDWSVEEMRTKWSDYKVIFPWD